MLIYFMTTYDAVQRHPLVLMTVWSVQSTEIQCREGADQESQFRRAFG